MPRSGHASRAGFWGFRPALPMTSTARRNQIDEGSSGRLVVRCKEQVRPERAASRCRSQQIGLSSAAWTSSAVSAMVVPSWKTAVAAPFSKRMLTDAEPAEMTK